MCSGNESNHVNPTSTTSDNAAASSSSPLVEQEREETPQARDESIKSYLDSFVNYENRRVHCCGASRSIYCAECGRLLLERSELPADIRDGAVRLPFQLDIILNDRRVCATGIHAYILLQQQQEEVRPLDDHDLDNNKHDGERCGDDVIGEGRSCDTVSNCGNTCNQVTLIDLNKGDEIPSYSNFTDTNNGQEDDERKITCVLFPSKDSIPLSDVAHRISRLIVLDCKWNRSKLRDHSKFDNLTKVHLTSPPPTSHYWRWHAAGPGMISTIEAVYCAAWEVRNVMTRRDVCTNICDGDKDKAFNSGVIITNNDDSIRHRHSRLLHILFLFAYQRATVQREALQEGRLMPFTEEGKSLQRQVRKCAGTAKQLRDRKKGKKLKEAHRLLLQKNEKSHSDTTLLP